MEVTFTKDLVKWIPWRHIKILYTECPLVFINVWPVQSLEHYISEIGRSTETMIGVPITQQQLECKFDTQEEGPRSKLGSGFTKIAFARFHDLSQETVNRLIFASFLACHFCCKELKIFCSLYLEWLVVYAFC